MKIVRVLVAVHLFVALVDIVPSYGQVTQPMIDAAKKEGEVAFYGAIPVNIVKRITDLFEKKYSITVKHWRGDATEIVNRVLTESRAGRPTFDVTLGNEAVMQALNEKGLLGVFDPPAAKGYPKQFRDPDLRITAWRVLPYGINYNYQQIKADEAPKTYEELLLPKWKGKFVSQEPTGTGIGPIASGPAENAANAASEEPRAFVDPRSARKMFSSPPIASS